jgi:hypothetical protein
MVANRDRPLGHVCWGCKAFHDAGEDETSPECDFATFSHCPTTGEPIGLRYCRKNPNPPPRWMPGMKRPEPVDDEIPF